MLWQTTGSHSIYNHLLWKQYLESEGKHIRQFHGSLRVSIQSMGNEALWLMIINVGSMASEPDLLRLHNPLSSQM
jgi:hypothetical protein